MGRRQALDEGWPRPYGAAQPVYQDDERSAIADVLDVQLGAIARLQPGMAQRGACQDLAPLGITRPVRAPAMDMLYVSRNDGRLHESTMSGSGAAQ